MITSATLYNRYFETHICDCERKQLYDAKWGNCCVVKQTSGPAYSVPSFDIKNRYSVEPRITKRAMY